jgi:hypothetical protein
LTIDVVVVDVRSGLRTFDNEGIVDQLDRVREISLNRLEAIVEDCFLAYWEVDDQSLSADAKIQ